VLDERKFFECELKENLDELELCFEVVINS
jgi:hypothetical protein